MSNGGSALGGVDASELFQLLRDGAPRTVSDLAAVTGLARSTVNLRLDALRDLGLVGAADPGVSTGGRPPRRIALQPQARLALAIDVGASHVRVGLTNLIGDVLVHQRAPISVAEGPDPVLGRALELVDPLLAELGRNRAAIIAIGIGLPGPVHFETGRPSKPPLMPGWDAFDVPGWFADHIDAPVLVDNDVNIMALGEHSRLDHPVAHFLFVKVATGIGAGIISGRRLQRGAQGIAGDIGHVRVSRGTGVLCRCGNEGCLEALASGPAVAAELGEHGVDAASARDVVELVSAGDLRAIQAVRQAGRDLGEVLAASISFLNPSVITIGGQMAAAGEHLLAGVREVVYQRAMPLATRNLQIATARTGDKAGLIGAGMLAIEHALVL
ncbi:ROK family transcriptional regulator [Microbacterium stercoris]|uniref:ROK family transcriptional regulator n=1 Tax=Microbacterium stercoris TaxID=2820289 RepID=A0A939QM51_9MICO|nr:ROK family transcriptional regulator [Microbacterium stercoris]MBO3662001.1 ROK family transcriptional regulator [Microbacterium stercoris]